MNDKQLIPRLNLFFVVRVLQLQRRAEQMKKNLEQQEKELEEKMKAFEAEREAWEDQNKFDDQYVECHLHLQHIIMPV